MNDENIQSNSVCSSESRRPADIGPAASPPPRRRREQGKVARLPLEMRNLVNHSLRDGARYAEVIALLTARGFAGFKRTHLMAWARNGYRHWLAQQERFDNSQKLSERALTFLGRLRADGRCELADLNDWLMAAQLNQVLQDMNGEDLKKLLADKPDEFFRIARTVVGHTGARALRQQAELERLKYELEIRKIEERERRRLEPKGVSREEMARIHAKLKMM
jgi:hypothetical protein